MIERAKWLAKEAVLRMKYMTDKGCIFCKIVHGKLKSNILYEDDRTIAIRDINPIARVHILIVPKKHIESVETIGSTDSQDLIAMFDASRKLAREKKLDAFRLSFNAGKYQHVSHLHMHLLAGKKIQWSKL